jgi:hypothetical protein
MISNGYGERLEPIAHPKLLLVEGQDEEKFFTEFLRALRLQDIEIRSVGGARKLRPNILTVNRVSRDQPLVSLGIVRDADNNSRYAFQSVCQALRDAGFAVPANPLELAPGNPRVMVMIIPSGRSTGMLEDVCLTSVTEDPAMSCVQEYFRCLQSMLDRLPRNIPKARIRSFLISRELLEEAHFEFLQTRIESWRPQMPQSPTVQQVHALLASRYKPTLSLGVAAEAGYWDFDHPAFSDIRSFLQRL